MNETKRWSEEWRINVYGTEHLITVEKHRAGPSALGKPQVTYPLWVVRVRINGESPGSFWIFRFRDNRTWARGVASVYGISDEGLYDLWTSFYPKDDYGAAIMAELKGRGAEWLLRQAGLMLSFQRRPGRTQPKR